MSTTPKFRLWLAIFLILVCILSVASIGLAVYYVGYYRKVTQRGAVSPCIANLKILQGAKDSWALENGKISNDVPADSDLFGPHGYISQKPKCPQGGVYTIGKVGDWPRCTISEHDLEIGLVEVFDESGKPIAEAVVMVGTEGYRTTPYGMGYANTNSASAKCIVVSKTGYKAERVELPVAWPVKVMLRRSE